MSHILVIDDEAPARKLLSSVLELEGYSVATAGDGESGLRELGIREADLIITDVVLPGMDSFELLPRLKEHAPRVPVIALSSEEHESFYYDTARLLGASWAFMKPIRPHALVRAVEEILSRTLFRFSDGEPIDLAASSEVGVAMSVRRRC